ncbi:MAG: carboxypeptidase-like regulatory domain-containing protein [Treponema sp.]|nr:carboxypeptidase-like regulatory domain-containing protein [Treponema sp.]
MRKSFNVYGMFFALLTAFSILFVSCGGGTTSGRNPELAGDISIDAKEAYYTDEALTATYTGSETVSYQWKKGTANVGANSNTFTPAETGSYTVTVSAAGYDPKTSDPVSVIENLSLDTLSGTITITPHAGGLFTGNELRANYTGSESVSYQWKKDGVNVGTDTTTFTPTEGGSYTVTVSATGYHIKTSDPITVQNSGNQNLSGDISIDAKEAYYTDEALTATYTGSETVSYQWKKGTANVGTNSNTFTPAETGSYTVTVSATGYDPKTSDPVTVVVDDSLDTLSGTITITPHADGLFTGNELRANYTGSESVSYQWKKDGVNVGTDATTFTPTEGGSYTVTVSATGYHIKTSSAVNVIEAVDVPFMDDGSYYSIFFIPNSDLPNSLEDLDAQPTDELHFYFSKGSTNQDGVDACKFVGWGWEAGDTQHEIEAKVPAGTGTGTSFKLVYTVADIAKCKPPTGGFSNRVVISNLGSGISLTKIELHRQ